MSWSFRNIFLYFIYVTTAWMYSVVNNKKVVVEHGGILGIRVNDGKGTKIVPNFIVI